MLIGIALFLYKSIHIATLDTPDTHTKNQIDVDLKQWRKSMVNGRAYRGADIASDNSLVTAQLNQK